MIFPNLEVFTARELHAINVYVACLDGNCIEVTAPKSVGLEELKSILTKLCCFYLPLDIDVQLLSDARRFGGIEELNFLVRLSVKHGARNWVDEVYGDVRVKVVNALPRASVRGSKTTLVSTVMIRAPLIVYSWIKSISNLSQAFEDGMKKLVQRLPQWWFSHVRKLWIFIEEGETMRWGKVRKFRRLWYRAQLSKCVETSFATACPLEYLGLVNAMLKIRTPLANEVRVSVDRCEAM